MTTLSTIKAEAVKNRKDNEALDEECSHYWVPFEGWQNIKPSGTLTGEWGVHRVKCVRCLEVVEL